MIIILVYFHVAGLLLLYIGTLSYEGRDPGFRSISHGSVGICLVLGVSCAPSAINASFTLPR